MSIVAYNPTGATPADQLQAAAAWRPPLNPLDTPAPITSNLDELNGPKFATPFLRALQTDSVIGGLLTDTLPYLGHRYLAGGEIDPKWNVKSLATDNWLNDHPWMIEHFQSGVADEFPNRARFDAFTERQRQDWLNRQIAGQNGLVGSFIYGTPALALDFMAGGAIGDAVGAGETIAAAGKAIQAGSVGARIANGAVAGAALNLAQEQAARVVNPYRNVPENEAAAWATGMGLAFGSMIPLLGSGKNYAANKIGETTSSRRIQRMQKQTAEAMKAPEVASLENAGKADAEALKGVAAELDATLQAVEKVTPPDPTLVGSARSVSGLSNIRERLVELHKSSPESSLNQDMMDGYEQNGIQDAAHWSGTFKGKLPSEIRDVLTQYPEIRRFVKVTDDANKADGWDSYMTLGHDRWVAYAIELAGGESRLALEWARKSNDPEARFLAALHDNAPMHDAKVPQIAVATADLPPGTTFSIHGERFTVQDGELGPTIRDGDAYPEVPAWSVEKLPIDKGSVKLGSSPEVVGRAATEVPPGDIVDPDNIRAMGAADRSIGDNIDAAGTDTRRSFTILDTPETRPQIDALKAKYGDQVEFLRHPQQDEFDRVMLLKELDKDLKTAQPADLGAIKGKLAKALGSGVPLGTLAAPGPTWMRSPSIISRKIARTLLDFAWPTQESADHPITNVNNPPAEGLKWQHQARADQAVREFHAAMIDGLAKGPITYTMGDGETINLTSRLTAGPDFRRAVWDFMVRENARARGGEVFDHPPAIKKAADALNDFYTYMGKEAHDIGILKGLREDAYHVPRRWLSDQIRLNHDEFVRLLVTEFEKNRTIEFTGGGRVKPETRPVIESLLDNAGGKNSALSVEDVAQIRELQSQLKKLDETAQLTEGMLRQKLGDDLYARYIEEVGVYHKAAAESTFETLTQLENTHGVEDAIPSFAARRKLEIDETAFGKFLDRDAQRIAEMYDRQMSGRVAVRQAIRNNEADLAPIVEGLTGKSLVESGYDPGLLMEALKRDYQRHLDANVGTPAQTAIEKALRADADIFTHKLAELEGRPAFPGNPAAQAGWKLWLERQTLRLPYIAQLGKMAISAWNDAAATMFYKSMTPDQLSGTIEAVSFIRQVKVRRDIEGLYVAFADLNRSVRAMEVGDIADLPDHRAFGPGRTGAFLQHSDSAIRYAADKFTMLTGINRWNTNMKRWTAHLVMQEVIDGSRRMAKAAELMAGGQTEEAAIRNAGLSAEDALRLNRLGFNGQRSQRLMAILDEHGVDLDGNKVNSTHKGYISPEMHAWSAKDRGLRDALCNAVNSETMNVIVEPKLGSKPLSSTTWIGRAFNQFQSFAYAWGNQQVPIAMQRPGNQIAQYAGVAVGVGALTDAIHNQLSGRRNIDDTLALWRDKPFGMVYAAVNRSGLFGWFSRPLGLLEQTPIGPAKLLGNNQMSTMYARPMTLTGQLGPFFNWADNLASGTTNVLFNGDWSDKTKRQLWNALPYHNLWQVEGINRLWEHSGGNSLIGPNARYQPDRP